jgi:SAM-dependent methyltransferase
VTREQRLTFGEVADWYQRARPTYPAALFDAIVDIASLHAGDRVLEVGAGTGKATDGFVARGLGVTAVEPSPGMAAVLRARLDDGHGGVVVQECGFEDCAVEPGSFAVVAAGQSWHWVDPVAGLVKAADALRAGGWLALFWNRPELGGSVWHDELQPIYEHFTPHMTHAKNTTQAYATQRALAQLEGSGRFGPGVVREFPWASRYTTSEYVELLGTYSDHRILPEETRAELHGAIGAWLDDRGGVIEHPYVAELVAAPVASR